MVRVGVIGSGSLGAHHARIYAALAQEGRVAFVGVYDIDAERAASVVAERGGAAYASLDSLLEDCDGVSIVTPTVTHFAIAEQALRADKGVLVEKPITNDHHHAEQLVALAKERDLPLQVGHIERFNPAYSYLKEVAQSPRFIESHRLSPFPGRSVDVGVVLDLMIHDLDIVLSFVQSPVVRVDACGARALSAYEDIANVRLRFENGCVANLTASRVSAERMRKIRVFSGGEFPGYFSLDFHAQKGEIYRLARSDERESSLLAKLVKGKRSKIVSEFQGKLIVREPAPLEREEPLRLELASFVNCLEHRAEPVVTGEAGRQALELATEIIHQIESQGGYEERQFG